MYYNTNRFVLNSDKTYVMVIGSRAYLKKIESFNVFINATLLNRVHSTKCLGVLIDDELNWSSHVFFFFKAYFIQNKKSRYKA